MFVFTYEQSLKSTFPRMNNLL